MYKPGLIKYNGQPADDQEKEKEPEPYLVFPFAGFRVIPFNCLSILIYFFVPVFRGTA